MFIYRIAESASPANLIHLGCEASSPNIIHLGCEASYPNLIHLGCEATSPNLIHLGCEVEVEIVFIIVHSAHVFINYYSS